jgi:phosphonate transport system substrate-binding protein
VISRRVVLALLLLLACGATHAAATVSHAPAELVLGRVSDDPKTDYGKLKALLDYVVPRMADIGITGGRVLMARDNQQMLSYLRRGKVDWVTETAGAAATYSERAGAETLLLSERGGLSIYQSVLFARRDSGIRSIADLRGRTIAFQSQASTSAYLLPANDILKANLPLLILASPADRPSVDVVGFVFARSELNISTWVEKGLVDAGAFSEQDWQNDRYLPPSFREDLVVFHRTGFVPRALELVRADLDVRVKQRLSAILIAAADDPAARAALSAYYDTTRFRPVDAAARESLAQLRGAVTRVHSEVE